MSKDLTAALDAATRQGYTPSSNETLTGAVAYGIKGGGNDLSEALDQLTKAAGNTTRENKTLPPKKDAPPIPARVGSSARVGSASGGSGLAFPLTETAYSARLFWAERAIVSTDGLFAFRIAPVKRMTVTDGVGNTGAINFADPS